MTRLYSVCHCRALLSMTHPLSRSRRELLLAVPVGFAPIDVTFSTQTLSGARLNKLLAEWMRARGPARYQIPREAGTDRRYSSPLNRQYRQGTFACAGCSRCRSSLRPGSTVERVDPVPTERCRKCSRSEQIVSLFSDRNEIFRARIGARQGHLFSQGPSPSRLPYRINGLAPQFTHEAKV